MTARLVLFPSPAGYAMMSCIFHGGFETVGDSQYMGAPRSGKFGIIQNPEFRLLQCLLGKASRVADL